MDLKQGSTYLSANVFPHCPQLGGRHNAMETMSGSKKNLLVQGQNVISSTVFKDCRFIVLMAQRTIAGVLAHVTADHGSGQVKV